MSAQAYRDRFVATSLTAAPRKRLLQTFYHFIFDTTLAYIGYG